MSSELKDSEELKAKYAEIAALKKAISDKQINSSSKAPIPASYSGQGRGGFRGQYFSSERGRGRGFSRGSAFHRASLHRNMTIVFNADASNSTKDSTMQKHDGPDVDDSFSSNHNLKSRQSYVSSVSKGGMSLVNSIIYDQDKVRNAEKANQIKAKIKQQKQLRLASLRVSKYKTKFDSCDKIKIDDMVYALTRSGNKLIPLSLPFSQEQAVWNGKRYSPRPNGALKCVSRHAKTEVEHCRYFSRTGICQKGTTCKYNHDRQRIKLCVPSLYGSCENSNCLLSHERTEQNTPLCKYHLQNKCTNPHCRFQHTKPEHFDEPNTEIWTCRPFAIGGWCIRGSKCPFLHLLQCPDFEETGTCPRNQSCGLSHPHTLRTQELMTRQTHKYERKLAESEENQHEEVLIESDDEIDQSHLRGKKITLINSYTIDPSLLFICGKTGDGKYDFYIDTNSVTNKSATSNTFEENSEFMIHLETDSETTEAGENEEASSSDSDSDGLEHNTDYVELAH